MTPKWSLSPNFSEKQVAFSQPETVQKDYTNDETSPDPDGVNYARPLKIAKVERIKKKKKWGGGGGSSYTCALMFKPSRLSAKGELMALAKAFYLNKDNITFNGI
jgi:hypothetical protein